MKTPAQAISLLPAAIVLIIISMVGIPVTSVSADDGSEINWTAGSSSDDQDWDNEYNWSAFAVPYYYDTAKFLLYAPQEIYTKKDRISVGELWISGDEGLSLVYGDDNPQSTISLFLNNGKITTSGTGTHTIEYNIPMLLKHTYWNIGESSQLIVTGNVSAYYSSPVTGSLPILHKNGSGTLALYGINNTTYNGGTILNAGTLLLGHDTAAGTGDITVSDADAGQTIRFASLVNIPNDIDVLNQLNMSVANGNSATYSGIISGDSDSELTYNGDGTLTFTGGTSDTPLTFGTFFSEEGKVVFDGTYVNVLGNAGATQFTAAGGDIILQNGADVQLTPNYFGTVHVSGNTLIVTGDGTSLDSFWMKVEGDAGHIIVTDNATANFENSLQINGNLGGSDMVIQSGAVVTTGYVELEYSQGNTVTGNGSQLLVPWLYIGDDSDLTVENGAMVEAPTRTVLTESSTLILDNGTFKTDELIGEGTVSISGDDVLTVGIGDVEKFTFSGLIQNVGGGSGTVIKTGDSEFTLDGTRSTFGSLFSQGGTVILDGINLDLTDSYTEALVANGGDIILENGADVWLDGQTLVQGNALTITGSDTLLTSDGVTVINGDDSVGNLTVEDAATLILSSDLRIDELEDASLADDDNLIVKSGAMISAGLVDFAGSSTGIITGDNSQLLTHSLSINDISTLTITEGGAMVSTGLVDFTGSSTGIITGDNSQLLTDSLSVNDSSTLTVIEGGVVEADQLTGSGTLSISGDDALTVGIYNSNSAFSGLIQNADSNAGTLTKTGTGTFTLTGGSTNNPSTFGNLTSEGGKVILDGANINLTEFTALAAQGGDITLQNSSVVQMNDSTGQAQVYGGALNITGDGTSLTGVNLIVISSNDSLTVSDNATLDLTGDLTVGVTGYADMTVESGAKVSTRGVNIAGSGTVVGSGSELSTGYLNTGSLFTVTDGGMLAITNNLDLQKGSELAVKNDAVAEIANIIWWDSGSSITINGGTLRTDKLDTVSTFTPIISIFGEHALTVGINNGSSTFDGLIQDVSEVEPGRLTKTGTGTFTLTGDNTYTGGTTLSVGTIKVGHNNALGTGVLTVAGEEGYNDPVLIADASDIVLGNTIVLNDTQLGVYGDNNLTINGVITGIGGLEKEGSGILTLSGINTYSGSTNINAGTVVVSGGNAIGDNRSVILADVSGATLQLNNDETIGALAGGGSTGGEVNLQSYTLTVGNTNNTAFAGVVSGAGSLVKQGSGKLTLSSINTYSGDTLISGGSVIASGGFAISDTGTLTLSNVSGATFQLNANETIGSLAGGGSTGGEVNLQSYTLTIADTNNTVFEGVISGTGGLVKQGSGMLTLNGDNTYSSGTTISEGSIAVGNDNAIGTNSLTVTGVSDLRASVSSVTLANAIVLNDDLTISGDNNLALNGVISGMSVLAKTEGGTLTLNNANTYRGGTTLSDGGIAVGSGNAIGTNSLTVAGTSELSATASSITLGNAVTLDGELTVSGDNNLTLNGIISGTSILAKTGNGTLTLNGDNSYSGGTTLSNGGITIGNNSAIGNGAITVDGTSELSAGISSVALHNAVTLNDDLTISGDNDLTLNGMIDGKGALAKIGNSTLTLNSANTYTGGTTISGGVININSSNDALGTGTLTFTDDATIYNNKTVNVNNAINLKSHTMTIDSNETQRLHGDISGTGSIIFDGNVSGDLKWLYLYGNNTFDGGITSNGGRLAVVSDTAFGHGALTVESYTILAGIGSLKIDNEIVLNAALDIESNDELIFSGKIRGEGTLEIDHSDLAVLTLSGDNTYTGGTTLDSGALQVSHNNALGTGALTVDTTPSTSLPPVVLTASLLAGIDGAAIANDIILETELQVIGSNDMTLGGDISGEGGLNKTDGDHILTLTGTNTYSGGTNIEAGTVIASGGNAIGDTGIVTLADVDGATLQLNADETIGGLAGGGITGGVVQLGNNSLTVNRTDDTTFDGVISGIGSLVLQGDGTLTLSGMNTFTGGTTLNGGVTTVNSDDAFGTGSVTVAGASGLTAGISSVTLANTVTLNDTLTISGDNDLTLDGVISDDVSIGSLTKEGSGTLTLSGANTYTGSTTLSGGTVITGHDSAFGDGVINVVSNSSLESNSSNRTLGNDFTIDLNSILTVDGTFDLLLTGDIDGEGGLTKEGDSTLTLSGNNTYTGATLISGGVLKVMGNDALGNGELTVLGSAELIVADIVTELDNDIAIDSGQTFTVGELGDMTLSGVISGEGSLHKVGDGTLKLSGNNTYTGGMTISDGVIELVGNSSSSLTYSVLGHRDSTLTFTGDAGLRAGADTLVHGTYTPNKIDLDSYVMTADGEGKLELLGKITGDGGSIVYDGSGELKLLNYANTFTGGVTLNGGTLTISNGALGTGKLTVGGSAELFQYSDFLTLDNTITLTADLSIQAGHYLILDSDIEGAGALTISPIHDNILIWELNGNNTFAGGVTLNTGSDITISNHSALGSGTLTVAGASKLSAGISSLTLDNVITLNEELTITSDNDLTLDSVIDGTGSLVKTGSGTLTLNSTNTYSGGTTLYGSKILLGSDNAIGTGTLTIADVSELSVTVNSVTLDNAVKLDDVLTIAGDSDLIFKGLISGTGSLIKEGSGTWTLHRGNAYSGGTTIYGGIIKIFNDDAIGTGTLTFMGDAGFQTEAGERWVYNDINLNSYVMTDSGKGYMTFFGDISGTGGSIICGTGQLALSGDNTFTGGVIMNGGVLYVGDNALGSGALTIVDTTTLILEVNSAEYDNAIVLNSNLTVKGSTLTFDGVISGTGALIKGDYGTLTLNGINNYSGGTELTGGETTIGSGTAFSSGAIAVSGTSELNAGISSIVLDNAVTLNDDLTVSGDNDLTLTNVIDGTGTLTKEGNSVLTLNGMNTYGGGTNINAGTIIAVGGNAIGDIGPVTLADVSGATLQLNSDETIGSLAGGGSTGGEVNLQSHTLVVGDENDTTFDGVVSGTGALVKHGTGILTLTGTNTYSGGTTLSAGGITVGSDNAIGTSSLTVTGASELSAGTSNITLENTVTLNGDLTISGDNDLTFDNTIDGSSTLIKVGRGTLTLNGDNTYNGSTTTYGGTIIVGSDTALSSGSLTIADTSELSAGISHITLGNVITLNNDLTISGDNDLILSGVISGMGALLKTGDSTLVLNKDNTYIGGTELTGGIIKLGSINALSTGTISVKAASGLSTSISSTTLYNTIALDDDLTITGDNDLTFGGVISGGSTGTLIKEGVGTLTLTGQNTYSGGTLLSGGTVIAGHDSAFGDGVINVVSNSSLESNSSNRTLGNDFTIDLNSILTVDGTFDLLLTGDIDGEGGLTKEGDSTLTLSGNNTYTGATLISGGVLKVMGNDALGNGELTVLGSAELIVADIVTELDNDIAIDSGQTFTVGELGDMTLSGVISGEGGLLEIGNSTLTLNGANTYSGGTTLSDGGIAVGNDDALGSGTLTVSGISELSASINNVTLGNTVILDDDLIVIGDNDLTLDDVVSGTGTLIKEGSGTLTLSGVNTYSGSTKMSSGGITVSNDSALGDGTLTVSGASELSAGISSVTLANAIILDNNLTITGNNDLILTNFTADAISGTGALIKEGNGTLVLNNGRNTYSGGTIISGGVIELSDIGAVLTENVSLGSGDVTFMGDAGLRSNSAGGTYTLNDINLNSYIMTADGEGTLELRGNISGIGRIVYDGSGRLQLFGDNTFEGGVTVNGGELQADIGGLGTGTLTIAGASTLLGSGIDELDNAIILNDTLTVSSNNDLTLDGGIGGLGALIIEDNGPLTINGANTYRGGTTLSGGSLTVGNDSALGTHSLTVSGASKLTAGISNVSLDNAVTLDEDLTISGDNDLTLDGVISGGSTSTLIKEGDGTLTLTGQNTYSGGTTLSGGTVVAGHDNAFGDGVINVASNSSLESDSSNRTLGNDFTIDSGSILTVDGTFDLLLSGDIDGEGGLTKEGNGTLTLSGNNTYTGATLVSGGILQVMGDDALGNGELTILGSAELIVADIVTDLDNDIAIASDQTFTVGELGDMTLSGVISGDGELLKVGSGTLTLNNDNDYSGGTEISAGGITVGSDNALGDGTLTVSNAAELSAGISSITLGNAVTLDDDLTITGSNDLTLEGVIKGTGTLIKSDDGTLTLNGTNTYSGDTEMSSGGIEVGSDTALGDGALTVSGASELSAGISSVTLDNAITLDDDLTITDDNDLTLNNVIDGTGVLVKSGSGTLTLNGTNTYSGGTEMSAGVLTVGGDDAIGDGTLTVSGTSKLNASISSVTLDNAITLNDDLTISGNNDLTLTDVIFGTGVLTKEGSGTLTLSGTNTYSGGTNISGGTIIVSGGNAIGDIGIVTLADVSGATLQLNADETVGSLAGGGSMGGEVNLQGYTLTVGDANDTTFDGVISGTGGLVKQGDGALTLSGTNTYSGSTNIAGGTIIVSGSNTISDSGSVTLADVSGATLQLADDETIGSLTGGGSTGGEVKLQSYTLTVGDENDTTYAGVISGTGGLVKQGDGTLIFSNSDNIYTGGTTVNEGILIINGNMASANMNVANGAMLAGVMSLAGNYNNAGTISPGNSIGTVTVGGNLTLTDTSIYDMEIESTAGAGVGNDLIDVGGTADVDGTLNIISISGYTPNGGDTFTILEADGGVSGEFSTILENFGAYDVKAIYDANDITIQLIAVPFTDIDVPDHLVPAADAFTRIADNNPTGDMATVINQLQGLTDAQLIAAFEQTVPNYLVPQAEATFKGIDVQNNNFNGRLNELRYGLPKLWSNNMQVQTPEDATAQESADPEVAINFAMQAQETLEQQQETVRLSGTQKETRVAEKDTNVTEKGLWGAWANGFGTFGDFDSQESQAGYEFNTGGVTFGFDYRVLDTLAAGAFLGYSNTGVTVDNGFGTSSFSSINTGMYMTWFNDEGFYASGLFGGGVNFYENNRRIRFGAIDRVAESDPTGFYLQTLATGGYEFKKGNWGIGPQLALQWVNLQIGSHSETGADDMNLDVGAFNGNSFVTRLGFRATYEYDTSAMLFVPELVGSWEHEYLDPIDTVNVGVPASGESFTYAGIGTGRDSGLIGVNLIGISHEAPVSFSVQYNVEFTPDDYIVNNVYAGVRISF
ncbi:autotransporter-associated beta strand repeat-containing protein [Planctomycetota bacterium]|nr:autotransporter-associated beta strand repeat-containing protein [Planctomycetota bacterium]